MFPYEGGILVIARRDDRVRTDPAFQASLKALLKGTDLRCGVSLGLRDFMGLRQAYLQSRIGLTTGDLDAESVILLFEDRYVEHILKTLETSTNLRSLCHPQVLVLARLDGGRGPEYIRSLQTYLTFGRNVTAAADRLFVHRNTLLYRLKRIQEVLGIDLEVADENMLFLLNLSCWIAPRLV